MECTKITVICFLVVCVIKCMAMSVSELEEFANFLEKTARLDETLKKGTSSDSDFDKDEPVSDHAWEESGKFEGDLILNDRQRRLIVEDVAEGLSRNGLKDSTKRWPDNEVIYYIQREHFSGDQVQAIEDGINDLAQAACVKFRPYKKGDRDAVVIQGSRRGCFSQVGYQGGYQVLNLSGRHPVGRGCFRHGTVVHELLHTLGFYHMQSSPDRDDYIDVAWENIIEPAKHNFRKYNSFAVSDFGVGYDYDSVLHYSRRAFSANGRDTLVPKQSGASIGQRRGLSDKDVQKLNKMYCDTDSNSDEQIEETPQKTITKKKGPKNKPFEGHGIGYHQGKTVVIKLPAAETYKLLELPKSHSFDYFSKASQAVSPKTLAEGLGVGKEIEYTYSPPATSIAEYYKKTTALEDKTESTGSSKYNETSAEYPEYYYNKDVKSTKPEIDENINNEENLSSPISKEFSTESHGPNDHDLDDAFERLGKIIKTHVYPSQIPNLDIYKSKLDGKEFYDPGKINVSEAEIVKEDKASSLLTKEKEDKLQNSKVINPKHESYEKNRDDVHKWQDAVDELPRHNPTPNDEQTINEDSSYRTSYPLYEMYKVKDDKLLTPAYATRQHIKDKNNYSSLYHPDHEHFKSPSDFHGKHRIFGEIAPVYDFWYEPDDHKYNNDRYNKGSYTDPSSEEESTNYKHKNPRIMQENHSKEKKDGHSSQNKQAYKLFGVLVPLNHDWYKIDYNPQKGSYSIEKSESIEDNR